MPKTIVDLIDSYDPAYSYLPISVVVSSFEAALKEGASPNVYANTNQTALMYACAELFPPTVIELLIDYGAEVNAQNDEGESVLAYFLSHCELANYLYTEQAESDTIPAYVSDTWHYEILQMLLKAGADTNLSDNMGRTPLMQCAFSHNAPIFARTLVQNGANPNLVDKHGRTALTIAAEKSLAGHFYGHYWNTPMVRFLVQHTSRDIPFPPDVKTPMAAALAMGNLPAVQALIEARYPVSLTSSFRHLEPIAAAVAGDLNHLQPYLQDGTALQCHSAHKQTPLMWAAALGRIDAVKALLDAGADVNETDSYNWTPLFFAAWQNQTEVLNLLLERGANINHKANYGWEDMHASIRGPHESHALRFALLLDSVKGKRQSHKEVCMLLWNSKIPKSDVSLDEIAYAGMADILRELLQQGKRVDVLTAARSGDIELVRDVIRRNRRNQSWKQIEAQLKAGPADALIDAIMRSYWEEAYLLIAYATDLDLADDPTGKTPLMLAAEQGNKHLVQILLAEGADPYKSSHQFKTAADYAEANGHTAIATIIRNQTTNDKNA